MLTLARCVSPRRHCPLLCCAAACLLGTALTAHLDGSTICPADMTTDSRVDGSDLGVLLGNWGSSLTTADLNADGIVNGADLGILLGSWGICETLPVSLNNEPVRQLLAGELAQPARVFVIGDSQATTVLPRLIPIMFKEWGDVLGWSGVPITPHTLAPFSMGMDTRSNSPHVTDSPVNPAATHSAGNLIGRIMSSKDFSLGQIVPGDVLCRTKLNTGATFTSSWMWNNDVEVRAVYEDNYVTSFSAEIVRQGFGSGQQAVATSGAGGYMLYKKQLAKPNTLQPTIQFEITANTSTASGETVIFYGGMWLEVVSGSVVTDRPWFMGVSSMSGSQLEEWGSNKINTDPGTFAWSDLGNYFDTLTETTRDLWPNMIMVVLGHNDGGIPPFPVPGDLRPHIQAIAQNLDALYTSNGVAPPLYVFTQLFCVDTIENAKWRQHWVDDWIPNAGGRITVISLSAAHNWKTYNGIDLMPDRLDDGNVHPATVSDAEFFYGSQGLLGIMLGTQP